MPIKNNKIPKTMSKEIKNTIVERYAVVRNTTEEMLANRQVEFVISSEAKDSYDTVFKVSGWDLKRYEQNPIVCYQHKSSSPDPDDIIGTSTLRVEGNQLIAIVTFEDEETNPKAEKVFRKVKNGTLRMASIGARINKGHWGDEKMGEEPGVIYFDSMELLEWSIVSLGSNPEALKRNDETMQQIRKNITAEMPVVDAENITQNVKRSVQEAQLIINQNK